MGPAYSVAASDVPSADKSTYEVLVDALSSYFHDEPPDLEWIRRAGGDPENHAKTMLIMATPRD